VSFGIVYDRDPDVRKFRDGHQHGTAQLARLFDGSLEIRHLGIEGDPAPLPGWRLPDTASNAGVPDLDDPVLRLGIEIELPTEEIAVEGSHFVSILPQNLEPDDRAGHGVYIECGDIDECYRIFISYPTQCCRVK